MELQVRSVGASLIPSLCCGTDGTQSDGVPKHPGTMPLVGSLVLQRVLLVAVKALDVLESIGVSCNEGSAAEELGVLGQVVVLCESARIVHDLLDGLALGKVISRFTQQRLTCRREWRTYLERILDDVDTDRLAASTLLGAYWLGGRSHLLMSRRGVLSLQRGIYLFFVTHGGGSRKAFGVPQFWWEKKPGENPWRMKTRRPCSGIKSVAHASLLSTSRMRQRKTKVSLHWPGRRMLPGWPHWQGARLVEKAAHPPEQTQQRTTDRYRFTRALLLPSACGLEPSYGRCPKRRFELVQGQIVGGVSAVCHDPGLGHGCGCSGSGVFTRASPGLSEEIVFIPQIPQIRSPSPAAPNPQKVGAWPSLGSPADWPLVDVKSREELTSKTQDATKNGSDSPQGLQLARLGVSGR